MKLKHIFYTAAAMAMLSFQACTLDEDTSGISNPDDFFRKFSECQSVVNGCYIPIKSIYTYTYMIATECVTDIAYCPSGTLDASLDISPAVPRMGSTVWRNGYLGVQRCNFAVNGLIKKLFNSLSVAYIVFAGLAFLSILLILALQDHKYDQDYMATAEGRRPGPINSQSLEGGKRNEQEVPCGAGSWPGRAGECHPRL